MKPDTLSRIIILAASCGVTFNSTTGPAPDGGPLTKLPPGISTFCRWTAART